MKWFLSISYRPISILSISFKPWKTCLSPAWIFQWTSKFYNYLDLHQFPTTGLINPGHLHEMQSCTGQTILGCTLLLLFLVIKASVQPHLSRTLVCFLLHLNKTSFAIILVSFVNFWFTTPCPSPGEGTICSWLLPGLEKLLVMCWFSWLPAGIVSISATTSSCFQP